jgi:hypothetical protein
VAGPFESPRLTVFGEYFPQDRLTVASFIWSEKNPAETYTIDTDEGLLLELDAIYPLRLARIALYDHTRQSSEELLNRLTSPGLGRAMSEASRVGLFIMNMELSTSSRLLLANIQAHDPLTPSHIQRACAALLTAHMPIGPEL